MSGWKETAALADECARATVSLISECNRQKIAEMLAHEQTKKELGHALLRLQQERDAKDEWRQECVEERAAHERTREALAKQEKISEEMAMHYTRVAGENDRTRQLLQVLVLTAPGLIDGTADTEDVRLFCETMAKFVELGGRRDG